MERYEYIVVGAGSAGAALAARLAGAGKAVLLLEAGGAGRHPWVNIPLGYGKVFHDARFNWKYSTEPEPELNNRAIYWPRGKVLGGSSAINAMVWVRGHPRDYAEWGAAAPGWGWEDVAPVFRRIETWTHGACAHRGGDGPLSVTDMSGAAHPLTQRFVKAAAQADIPTNTDYNGAAMEGAGYYQISTKGGRRASTAQAYLEWARKLKALRIETGAMATRILMEGRRASGIEYLQRGERQTAHAHEVILCGGAINSPQLLMLSGIGPAAHLREMGIGVVLDAPQVGRNLMDHLGSDHLFRTSQPSLNQVLRPWWGKALAGLQYVLTRKGPLAMSLNQGGGFIRLAGGDGPPDTQLYFSPLSYSSAPAGKRPLMSPDPFAAVRIGFNPCKPTSTGSITLRSSDPMVPPIMRGGYLATEHDRALMIAGTREVRRIASMPALQSVIETELDPGTDCATDDEILDFARRDAWTVFHQCGTCRMGRGPAQSVVDPQLRVHGISGLRVADASIFPTIPTGNTNAPAVMVGERAFDLITQG
ncbi:MAG TPA: GMC family oxidoreductase N-terminal domain-containing protein [Roseovarius sp.]